VAGLNPATWAGLMFQPKKKPTAHSNPLYIISWLLGAQHSNQLIIFHFAAERELLTFCMQSEHSRGARKGEEITWSEGAWLLSPVVVVAGHG